VAISEVVRTKTPDEQNGRPRGLMATREAPKSSGMRESHSIRERIDANTHCKFLFQIKLRRSSSNSTSSIASPTQTLCKSGVKDYVPRSYHPVPPPCRVAPSAARLRQISCGEQDACLPHTCMRATTLSRGDAFFSPSQLKVPGH
jgi:hypothetical protein